MFSWQKSDYEELCKLVTEDARILLIRGRDFETPYHVLTSFYAHLSERGYALLEIGMTSACPPHPLLPFAQAVSRALGQKKPSSKSLLPSIIKDITHSDVVSVLIESIINPQHTSVALDQRENDLLIQMECAANGAIPVFSFRGYSLFDENSKKLVNLLVSGQLNNDFPFLKDAKFLFLCEIDEPDDAYRRIESWEHLNISVSEPQQQNMEEILAELSPGLQLSAKDQEKLFCLSGGRLSVISVLVQYLVSKGQSSIDTSIQETVDATLRDRILDMGESGSALERVLAFAANIGSTFHIPLLKRAVDDSVCEAALEKSNQALFTECNQDHGKFVCREIWNFFYNCDKKRRREIARSLEQAVYYFDPYDYLTRAYYRELAGDIQDACELYFLAYNAAVQEGITPEKSLKDKIAELSMQCGLTNCWDALLSAYSAMFHLDYKSCAEILEELDAPHSMRLLLMKEYLSGLCLHKLGETLEYQEEAMLSMQKAAEHARNVEEGLWCDCQMALLSFLVNNGGDICAAQSICKDLTYYYTEKNYAPFAQKGLYALKRKWSAVYSVEIAVSKTEGSVAYFRNGLYPSQYLMALNNHAANLIVLGRYAEAKEYLKEAGYALWKFQTMSVNPMYLLSNYYLCTVLSGALSPVTAYESLLYVADKCEFGDWTIIFRLNCSIYMALAGELDRAEKALRELEKVSLDLHDDYYLFYVYANLAAVLYLKGRRTEAVCLLRENCSKPPLLFKATEKTYLEERSRQWISVMESIEIKDPKTFDTYLLDRHPPKTQWTFLGRGFLYSDIQFWSEP